MRRPTPRARLKNTGGRCAGRSAGVGSVTPVAAEGGPDLRVHLAESTDQGSVLGHRLGQERGGGLQAEAVDVGGVDAADERIDQPVGQLVAQALPAQGPDGHVCGEVGRGHRQITGRPFLAGVADQIRVIERRRVDGYAEHGAARQDVQPAVEKEIGRLRGDRVGHLVGQAELVDEFTPGIGPHQHGVRSGVDHRCFRLIADRAGEDFAAPPVRRLVDVDGPPGRGGTRTQRSAR